MRSDENAIAIIGMGCRFPGGANNIDEFWNLVRNGVDAVTEVPEDRWSIEDYYHENKDAKGKSHSKCGGFIDEFDQFDAKFFGINAREAEQLDPQQRQMLEIVWEALEDAGIKPNQISNSKTGVFIGGFTLDYKILQFADVSDIDTHTAVGSMMTMLSNRISYIYNLLGPSMSIDTACSSSLVALHLSCQSLRNGECDMAMAGGIELVYAPEYYVAESKGGFLSKDGKCKTFDESANGYVRGEGGGIVLLKPLKKAIADGNNIYAVIRETMVNQDGKTNGITVPNGESQLNLLKDVYDRAGVDSRDVQYVEAHGTGTGIGDPIEINVLGEFFGKGRTDENRCIISSVKSNIGHLEAASGIASLIKSVSILNNKIIAPHIGMKNLNSKIDLDKYKLRIPLSEEKWPEDGKRPIIGINSFGFGGTNAHVILEGYADNREYDGKRVENCRPNVLVLTAKSDESLKGLAHKYIKLLRDTRENLDNICYCALHYREIQEKRIVVQGYTKEDMIEGLKSYIDDQHDINLSTGVQQKDDRIVFVFTGMGPQWYAMGRELLKSDKIFLSTVEKCDHEFSKYLDWSIMDELLANQEESRISQTCVAQPLNFTIQLALFNMWESMGITPDLIIGHSVGEVAAFYAAGVYSFEDAVKISYYRSVLQQKLTGSGTMLAVGLPEAEASELIKEFTDKVSVAAINSNSSVTLSGDKDILDSISKLMVEKEVFNKFLKVTVPYHSVYMDQIKDELCKSLKDIKANNAKVRLYTTADGVLSDGTNLDNHYWVKNVRNTVYFSKAVTSILNEGYTNFIEVGPHPVLTNSVKELAEEMKIDICILPSIKRKEEEMKMLYHTYSEFICRGCKVDWGQVYEGKFKQLSLPKYSWNHEKFWRESEYHRERRLGIKEHPFIGYRKHKIMPFWELEANTYTLPFIKDHCISGRKLIAGAHYIEMALQVIRNYDRTKNTRIYSMENIQFKRALFLNEFDIANMYIKYDLVTGRLEISSKNVWDNNLLVNFASEFLRNQHFDVYDKVDVNEIRSRCLEQIDEKECYNLMHQMGFDYGPMFHGIKNIFIGENENLAELHTLGELDVNESDNVIHPVLLDGAFQTLIASQFKELNNKDNIEIKLPVSIDKITVYGEPKERLFVHSVITQNNEKSVIGNIDIYNNDGTIFAKVSGFVAKILENDDEHAVLGEKDLDEWFYGIEWNEQNIEDDEQVLMPSEPYDDWIILADNFGTGNRLAERLRQDGKRCIIFNTSKQNLRGSDFEIDCSSKEGYHKLIEAIDSRKRYGIVHLFGLDIQNNIDMTVNDIEVSKNKLVNSIRHLMNIVTENNIMCRVWVVTRNAVSIFNEKISLLQSPAFGMGRVISHNECIGLWGANIDIDNIDDSIDLLVNDIENYTREDEIAYRNGKRYVSRLKHIRSLKGNVPVKMYGNKIYIVTGALGSLGKITVNWMFEKGARHFKLIGRSKLPNRSEWKKLKSTDRFFEDVRFIMNLEMKGAVIELVPINIADEDNVKQFIQHLKDSECREIGGVIHVAGVINDQLMINMDQKAFDDVYDPKVKGAWLLNKYLTDVDLDFFIMYSSTGSVITAVGQVNYAAANSFMDALAFYRRKQGKPALSVGWGPWGVGMVKEKNLIEHYKYQRGMNPIYASTGMQALERLFGQNIAHAVVGVVDWPLAIKSYPGKPPLYNYLAEEDCNMEEEQDSNIFTMLDKEPDRAIRIEMIEYYIAKIIAETIHGKVEDIDCNVAINTLGVDSIIATELRNKINKECNINISIVDILGGISVRGLVEKNGDKILTQVDEIAKIDNFEDIMKQIEELSEEEAMILLSQLE